MTNKNTTHLHVSLHLNEEVDVDVSVDDGQLSLHLITVSLGNPHASSFFDLHGNVEQMERVVAALEQGLNEVLREQVDKNMERSLPSPQDPDTDPLYRRDMKDAGRGNLLR